MLDKILYMVGKSDVSIITSLFIVHLLVGILIDSLRSCQFLLIPSRIKFMDHIANCSTPCLNSAVILSVPVDL
jgi:hypothetical protein